MVIDSQKGPFLLFLLDSPSFQFNESFTIKPLRTSEKPISSPTSSTSFAHATSSFQSQWLPVCIGPCKKTVRSSSREASNLAFTLWLQYAGLIAAA
jgi:hypothetical protein